MSATQPSEKVNQERIAYHQRSADLDPGNNLFQCNNCGHYAGDPRPRGFISGCPACESIVTFYRIID